MECSEENCAEPATASGLCRRHRRNAYMREYARTGGRSPCSVEECDRLGYGRSGLCPMHYQRRRTLGDAGGAAPRFMKGAPLAERFWAKVNKDGPIPEYAPHLGPCWIWTAGRFQGGYGQFGVDGKQQGAHRVAYELVVGPIPEGLQLDHLCRVRACVNPSHLEPVTAKVNIMRGEGVAAKGARKTVCVRGHDLMDPANLKPNSRGARQCRACSNIARMDRYRRLGR